MSANAAPLTPAGPHTPAAPLLRTTTVWLAGTALLAALTLLCLSAAAAPFADALASLDGDLVGPLLSLADASPVHASASPTAGAVLVLAGLAGAFACARLWWILTTTCACAARGHAPSQNSRARRLVLAACGVALSVGAVAPAHAGDLSSLDGLPLPERAVSSQTTEPTVTPLVTPTAKPTVKPLAKTTVVPTAVPGVIPSAAPTATPTPGKATPTSKPSAPAPAHTQTPPPAPEPPVAAASTSKTHVVTVGDNLWRIARDAAPAASTAEVVASLHRANLDVIGDDPDLLLPGQVLTLPPPADTPTPSATPPATPTTTESTTTATEETR